MLIRPFIFQDQLHVIYENGEIECFSVQGSNEKIELQLLGSPLLINFAEKRLLLAEISPSKVKIYNSEFKLLFMIKQPFSNNVKVTAITSDCILIHDQAKHIAILTDLGGKFLSSPFPLTQKGKVTVSNNRVYRIDSFQNKFELDYLKI